jgi:hypothetical protein
MARSLTICASVRPVNCRGVVCVLWRRLDEFLSAEQSRRRPPNPVAVEQLQDFIEPLRTPPLPAEALSVPSPPQVTPNLLLHPVSNEAEALAGMPNRKVIHPTAKVTFFVNIINSSQQLEDVFIVKS